MFLKFDLERIVVLRFVFCPNKIYDREEPFPWIVLLEIFILNFSVFLMVFGL